MTTALNPDVLPAHQQADAHRSAMLDLFCAVTNDCVSAKLEPIHVSVHNYDVYGNGDWRVDVQFSGTDVESVDALASCYGLAPDDGEGSLYGRIGRAVVNGRPGTVNTYTGRPAVQP